MEIANLWYLIERDKLHRVISAKEYAELNPDSFILHQVFDNKHEATHEMIRLLQTAVQEVSHQLDEKDPGHRSH